jgi:hypothetical protein
MNAALLVILDLKVLNLLLRCNKILLLHKIKEGGAVGG